MKTEYVKAEEQRVRGSSAGLNRLACLGSPEAPMNF